MNTHICVCNNNNKRKSGYQLENVVWLYEREGFEGRYLGGAGEKKRM